MNSLAAKPRHGAATAALHRPWPLIVAFMAPALLLYGLFFLYPMARAVYLSLFHGRPASTSFTYVGIANYKQLLFDDPNFRNAIWHNLQIMVVSGTATLVIALTLALGLSQCGRGKNLFRVLFLFPNVMSAVATAILWSFVFNPSFGILNGLLRIIGLERFCHAWLGEPGLALPSLMVIQVWSGVGFYVLLFYAGILRIPADYMEAARIDGASGLQEFRYIILPLLSEIMKIAVIYIIINSLNVFALVFLVTEGNADRYVDVMLTYLYEQSFKNGNFGYACAIGVLLLIMMLSIASIVNRMFTRETVEL